MLVIKIKKTVDNSRINQPEREVVYKMSHKKEFTYNLVTKNNPVQKWEKT